MTLDSALCMKTNSIKETNNKSKTKYKFMRKIKASHFYNFISVTIAFLNKDISRY